VTSLTHAVKAEARRLGFGLIGVTTSDPPPHYDVYQRWLDAGWHGEMAYLAGERPRQRRADMRLILPECRSILVLGVRYPAPPMPGEKMTVSPGVKGKGIGDRHEIDGEARLRGRVASYAWGNDYHDILPQRLHALVSFMEVKAGHPIPNRWYTDTGPVMERDLAQRAGLGWIGKNTCLIHPQQGSYFLLAEILLGIELEPDQPFTADRCGSCTRCIEACPTSCILPDRTLDASRCISYLTIELKGAIPAALRPQMGDWVFGCDVCQQVCPWNLRFAETQGDLAFAPRPVVPVPDLLRELALTPEGFNRKFKGSPIKRAKRRGYLRNVSVALGNVDDPMAVPALTVCLSGEPEPLVRGHAAWALGRIGGREAIAALRAALQTESDPQVKDEIYAAFAGGDGNAG
jgi:epoxyqueuosine reductase